MHHDQRAWDDPVSVQVTSVGKGVFADRAFPIDAVIGEIFGELFDDSHDGSEYCMSVGEAMVMEPAAPFRFLNHSCEPNCEYTWIGDGEDSRHPPIVYLIALRNIVCGEELTIDYNWPAECAIPCKCNAHTCRGWIVSIDELDLLGDEARKP